MSTAVADVITLRRSARGAMAGGGTVSHEVYLDGRWIGWVGDQRPFTGARFGGRRWWAAHREAGDTAARWNSNSETAASGYTTRAAAVAALVATVERQEDR